MNQIIAEMQTYYERRAPVYDASMQYDDAQVVADLAPVIELMQHDMKGRDVLEIACGPCFWTKLVSQTAATILATDFNASTLQQARQKRLNWDKITLQMADAYDLPSMPQRFNAAFAVDWFAHVPHSRIHAFLRGLHKKLEPGSQITFCDQLPGTHSMSGIFDEEGNHIQLRTLPDGSTYRVIKHFFSDEALADIFSPYTERLKVSRFPEMRRIVVSYTI